MDGVDGVKPTFAAACAIDDPNTGTEGLAVFFVPRRKSATPDAALVRAIKAAVSRELGIAPAYVLPLDESDFPKTTSAKNNGPV